MTFGSPRWPVGAALLCAALAAADEGCAAPATLLRSAARSMYSPGADVVARLDASDILRLPGRQVVNAFVTTRLRGACGKRL